MRQCVRMIIASLLFFDLKQNKAFNFFKNFVAKIEIFTAVHEG